MKFSEEQVKEIVALREDLMKQVDKHQEGIEMLEKKFGEHYFLSWWMKRKFYKFMSPRSSGHGK